MDGDVAVFKRDVLLRKILFRLGAEQPAGLTVQNGFSRHPISSPYASRPYCSTMRVSRTRQKHKVRQTRLRHAFLSKAITEGSSSSTTPKTLRQPHHSSSSCSDRARDRSVISRRNRLGSPKLQRCRAPSAGGDAHRQ